MLIAVCPDFDRRIREGESCRRGVTWLESFYIERTAVDNLDPLNVVLLCHRVGNLTDFYPNTGLCLLYNRNMLLLARIFTLLNLSFHRLTAADRGPAAIVDDHTDLTTDRAFQNFQHAKHLA